MTIAMILEREEFTGPDLRWPLRIAALVGGELVCIVPGPEKNSEPADGGPAASPTREELEPRFAAALDEFVGAGNWLAHGRAKSPSDEESSDANVLVARLRVEPVDRVVAEAVALVDDREKDLLLFVTSADQDPGSVHSRLSPGILRGANGRVSYIVPGERRTDGDLVTTVAEGVHARAAMRLASNLATKHERPLTAVYVEPDLGLEAERVGHRILKRALAEALDGKTTGIERRVEIDDRVERGLLRACEGDTCDALFVGSPRVHGLGDTARGVGSRLVRGLKGPTLIGVRSGVPLRSRAQRFVNDRLDRFVPQLSREARTDLVERIQARSRWNFDFVSLTGLSTIIAAMGLIDDSPAVIIGAMLVAPLMTPLLGFGLALSQGNVQLLKLTFKTAFFGFLTAFAIGLLVGALTPGFETSTAEMDARDWPELLDLVIAFAAGLAAAYASGRPGLLAALPGVAIAAALLPPVATSGLATAIGNYPLAIGAMLLFLVNMVAIAFASYVSLWVVGIRFQPAPKTATRILRATLNVLILATSLALVLSPPRSVPPAALIAAIEQHLELHGGEMQLRARQLRLKWDADGRPVLQVDLGGSRNLSPEARQALLGLAREHLGELTEVRLSFRHEVRLE
jgi:uncharacterized hydrophobic protein (TIGR00271 family)